MAVTYTDCDIEGLLQEPKELPADWRRRVQMKPKRGHEEQQLDIVGMHGSEFRVILRKNRIDSMDFSVILAVLVPQSTQVFRLRRYNGRSHEHTNPIEGNTFYDFHIHCATERYQDLGAREDSYAETTDRYATVFEALRCLFADAGFTAPQELPHGLFGRK